MKLGVWFRLCVPSSATPVEPRQRLGCLRLSRHQRPQHLRNVAQLPGKVQSLDSELLFCLVSWAILCYSIFSQVNLLHLPIPISVVPGVPYCNSGPQISAVCPGCNLRHYRANVCGTVLRLQGLYVAHEKIWEDRRSGPSTGPSTGQDRRRWTMMDIHAKSYCKQRHESHRT